MTEQAKEKNRLQFLNEQEEHLSELITYRRPKQERGVRKFESILDATHELIVSMGARNFSLYDVADHADIAVGSVYHFFPSIESVFAALVERYDQDFWRIVSEYIPPEDVETWSDIIWYQIENSRHYINGHQQILIMILGPGQTWQTRQVDTVGDTAIARAMQRNIEQYFDVPDNPEPAELLHLSIRILESFWQLSYQRHGKVTREMQGETFRAICAYLELYWPRHIPRKEPAAVVT
jgi:AcrR family transcriptional regulator